MIFYTLKPVKTLWGEPLHRLLKRGMWGWSHRTPRSLLFYLSQQSGTQHFPAEEAKAFHSHAATKTHQEETPPKLCPGQSSRTVPVCCQPLRTRPLCLGDALSGGLPSISCLLLRPQDSLLSPCSGPILLAPPPSRALSQAQE